MRVLCLVKYVSEEKQILCFITYMWNVKNKTNVYSKNRNRLIDVENKLVVTSVEGIGRSEIRV